MLILGYLKILGCYSSNLFVKGNVIHAFFYMILIVALANSAKAEGLFSWLYGSGKEIIAEVKLVNKCQLDSKYFIVRDLETGKSAIFINGLAKLPTKTKSSIQLQLSPSVKHVTFSGNAAAAKKKMKLVADYSNRNIGDISKN